MDEFGEPRSFLEIDMGVDVVSSDGQRVGTLENVLADEQSDIFDGVIIDTSAGHRFVDAPEINGFRERAVLLNVPAANVERLPEPSANPAVIEHGGEEDSESALAQKLRRAWDLLSGRY